jgi:hypothetical protein
MIGYRPDQANDPCVVTFGDEAVWQALASIRHVRAPRCAALAVSREF